MSNDLVSAIEKHQSVFGLKLNSAQINGLLEYYTLVQEHNSLLHLVAQCSAEEFAVRHILESLTLLHHLPQNARFVDIGAGAGLPSLPCLIVREDLRAVLIESKLKKAGFLRTVLVKCELAGRAVVIDRQFEEIKRPAVSHITCRALDKFTQKLPGLLKWTAGRRLLFFGGPTLRQALQKQGVKFDEKLMPLSEQRYLFASLAR